jgi:hypothetical protein
MGMKRPNAKGLSVGRPGALGRLAHVPLEGEHNEAYRDTASGEEGRTVETPRAPASKLENE